MKAWDPEVQRRAVQEASRLFANVDRAGLDCEPPTKKREESNPGAPLDAEEEDVTEAEQGAAMAGAISSAAAAATAAAATAEEASDSAPAAAPGPSAAGQTAPKKKKAPKKGSRSWSSKPALLSEVLGAASRAGVSEETTAAAMASASRLPSKPRVRKHQSLPLLNSTTRVVSSVAGFMLADIEVRMGAAGQTPLQSEAGGSSAEELSDEEGRGRRERRGE